MLEEIQNNYKCKGCGKYFELAKIPEKVYDFSDEEYYWICPSCEHPNSSIIYKKN